MPVMARDLDSLTARTFDVLVVGGGIYGLTIAYDAAQRGRSVALIDRDDFGSGSSFNHLRTIFPQQFVTAHARRLDRRVAGPGRREAGRRTASHRRHKPEHAVDPFVLHRVCESAVKKERRRFNGHLRNQSLGEMVRCNEHAIFCASLNCL